jgi:hypothetical protein
LPWEQAWRPALWFDGQEAEVPAARAQVPRRVGNKYAQSGKNGVTPVVAAWLIDAAATGTVHPLSASQNFKIDSLP